MRPVQFRWLAAIWRSRFLENSDEHGWDILQAVFRINMLEKRGVLFQFVGYLIDNETAARRQRVVRFLEQGAFLVDFENAEGDAGKNVIAVSESETPQFLRKSRGIAVDDVDPRIVGELVFEIARKRRIQFEQEEMGIRAHPSRDFAGMDALARAVFGNYPWLAKIHFVGHALD